MGKLGAVRRAILNPRQTIDERLKAREFSSREPDLAALIENVRAQRITYLSRAALIDLADAVLEAEGQGREGAIVEAGTALGGSTIVLGKAKRVARPLWVFDAFGMIPPPSANDGSDVHARFEEISSGRSKGIGGDTYYGYRQDLLAEVIGNFRRCGIEPDANSVTFVKGYYENTMHIDFPVAIAHLDCDWYESMLTCLTAVEPHLVRGGRFVIDDYYDWSGARKAVDEFFADRDGFEFVRKSRLHIVKRAD